MPEDQFPHVKNENITHRIKGKHMWNFCMLPGFESRSAPEAGSPGASDCKSPAATGYACVPQPGARGPLRPALAFPLQSDVRLKWLSCLLDA